MLVAGFRKDSEKYNNIYKDQKTVHRGNRAKEECDCCLKTIVWNFWLLLMHNKLKFYEINLCFSCVGCSGRNWWGSSLITFHCYWDRFPAIKLCRLAIFFFVFRNNARASANTITKRKRRITFILEILARFIAESCCQQL